MDSSGSRYTLRASGRSVSYKEKPEDADEFDDDLDDDMVAESPETPGTPTPAQVSQVHRCPSRFSPFWLSLGHRA